LWRSDLLSHRFADGWAEEIIVVVYLLTLWTNWASAPRAALMWSSLLRGVYHLYQGFRRRLGNIAMGLVVRLRLAAQPTAVAVVIAHGLIDRPVAFRRICPAVLATWGGS